MRSALLFVPVIALAVGVSSIAATACDDDTIGENIDQAIETVEEVGEDIGEEIEDIGDGEDASDDETPEPEATATP